MRSRTGAVGVAVLVTVLTGSPVALAREPAAAGAVRAWTVGAMTSVARDAPAVARPDVTINAARGQTESFQVAVHAGPAALTNGRFAVGPLAGPGGHAIGTAQLTRYREFYVHVAHHSPGGSGPVVDRDWFPDALLPFVDPATGRPPHTDAAHRAEPYTVGADRTQPFWVDVRVPTDAVAGNYTGRWSVHTDQGTSSGSVTVHVYPFALPSPRVEASSFGVYHAGAAPAIEKLLVAAGLAPTSVPTRRQPGLVADGLHWGDVGFWSGADVSNCHMDAPPAVTDIRAAVAAQDPSLELYNYTADEISNCPQLIPKVKAWARNLHAAGVRQLITMVPRGDLFDDGTGRPAVDDWVLLPLQARAVSDELLARVRASGGELWSYEALVQGANTPSWQIDMPPANYRVLPGFLNARMGYTGVLYWTVDYWRPNPWDDVTFRCCYPGDGMLVYPGAEAGVVGAVPSIRLMWIREGIDDYAYVDLLRRSGATDWRQVIAPAASSWSDWTRDAATLDDVRSAVAARLDR